MSAALTWLATFGASRFALELETNSRSHLSPYSGSTQIIDLIGDRWLASLTVPVNSYAVAQQFEAFVAALRGRAGTVALWHLARPAPSGTMRGAPVLSALALQGAQSLAITTTAGATVKAGDMLGVAGQLLMVASDATASGVGAITVPIVNRLRAQLANASAVVWDKPTALFRQTSERSFGAISYGRARADVLQAQLTEHF